MYAEDRLGVVEGGQKELERPGLEALPGSCKHL